MGHLESASPVELEYGRRATSDLATVGLAGVQAEGQYPIVRGESPLAADFLRLTIEKLREPVLADGAITATEFAQAMAALQDPDTTVVAPMTVAAWADGVDSTGPNMTKAHSRGRRPPLPASPRFRSPCRHDDLGPLRGSQCLPGGAGQVGGDDGGGVPAGTVAGTVVAQHRARADVGS
jgi:hypothetical protein